MVNPNPEGRVPARVAHLTDHAAVCRSSSCVDIDRGDSDGDPESLGIAQILVQKNLQKKLSFSGKI
jgi:hypothetical protein